MYLSSQITKAAIGFGDNRGHMPILNLIILILEFSSILLLRPRASKACKHKKRTAVFPAAPVGIYGVLLCTGSVSRKDI